MQQDLFGNAVPEKLKGKKAQQLVEVALDEEEEILEDEDYDQFDDEDAEEGE